MTMYGIDARRADYAREAILNASPARLLTMLYDRLILDLQRAEIAQDIEDWESASTHLLHAQDILAELTSSLKVDEWDGAEGLLGVYTFATKALVFANIHRDVESTRVCITLLEPLRQTWHEAAAQAPTAAAPPVERSLGGTLGVA
ncbi:flagellar export chaperone FliS [Salinibacterium sp. dk2585]|uniref:flagellar export chaperone FliS n=1 Tax=unclassified Salinibacterium TaxID=2632331 RepID=UPI0011C253AB|nr:MULTISPECIES: flagellar export chaperone FliS [unclassified Salinibacterium]QEE60178.1 flagellar export chaperone FliS [Salinibacterium sp. dk2585]TXK55250.1 flagellar export chaperone FliS [Salinibacterium sp. dk5596]